MKMTQENAEKLLNDHDGMLTEIEKEEAKNTDIVKHIVDLRTALHVIADPNSDLSKKVSVEDAQKNLPALLGSNTSKSLYKKYPEYLLLINDIKEILKPEVESVEEKTNLNTGIDWSFWLRAGLLGASLVASIALCVTAAVTLNPVIAAGAVVITALTGFALAKNFGFFNGEATNLNENTHSPTP
jgi:hypothetical protein